MGYIFVKRTTTIKLKSFTCPALTMLKSCFINAADSVAVSLIQSWAWITLCGASHAYVSFLWVLWFPPTFQNHPSTWTGHAKLSLGVNMCVHVYEWCPRLDWHPIQVVYSHFVPSPPGIDPGSTIELSSWELMHGPEIWPPELAQSRLSNANIFMMC